MNARIERGELFYGIELTEQKGFICLIPRHPPGVVQTRNISDIVIINSSIHASTFARKYGHGGIQGGILYNSNR